MWGLDAANSHCHLVCGIDRCPVAALALVPISCVLKGLGRSFRPPPIAPRDGGVRPPEPSRAPPVTAIIAPRNGHARPPGLSRALASTPTVSPRTGTLRFHRFA